MLYAAIMAGGRGERLGGDLPKQFLPVCSRPVIIRTLDVFMGLGVFDCIYIGMAPDWIEHCTRLLKEHGYCDGSIKLVAGGQSRHLTMVNILREINNTKNDIIVTHDAARPFVSGRMILDSISAAKQHGACGAYIESTDSLALSQDGDSIGQCLQRNGIYLAQTPQSFRLDLLLECIDKLSPSQAEQLTDACSVFRLCGLPVKIIPGESSNLKITTKSDMEYAEYVATTRKNTRPCEGTPTAIDNG
ncbi:MAG: 2-C-methyl-D-erythritol 4-phosphate cytidylyltransferase [Oscillospiraceae bacterium]|nr:2-C-methyl-D-erythritol 4-phosphate cytidylyltransferase [Oscillospiraceae bacterium]